MVVGQPQSDQEDLQALIALVSCPAGSLLYRDTYLFTGDHLSWRLDSDGLFTARQYCQYSWEVQRESVEKLLQEISTWILPGHGYRFHAVPEVMRRQLRQGIVRMGGD